MHIYYSYTLYVFIMKQLALGRQLFLELNSFNSKPMDATHTIAISAVEASFSSCAAAIIVITTTGRSAYLVSKYRPRCAVVAVTSSEQVARQFHLYRGVLPILITSYK